jgi:hypothetical protein
MSTRRRGFLHDIGSRELGLPQRQWESKLQSSRCEVLLRGAGIAAGMMSRHDTLT